MHQQSRRCARATAIAAMIAATLGVAPALAQAPIGNPPVPSILTWSQKEQLERYPAIETVYRVATVPKGAKVHDLPLADTQINPKITFAGRTQSVDTFMTANRITGLIAVKDGKVILEKYALGRKPEDRWTSFSVAKSVTATLIGAAIKDRWIRSIHDPVTYYVPELRGSGYDTVTIRQLLTMTSGVKWNEDYTDRNSDVSRSGTMPWTGGVNPLVSYMSKLPRAAKPGTTFNYSTGETDMAGIVLSRALAGKSLSQYASEKIWAPYGMEQDAIWMVDRAGHERGGCCMSMTLRDYARIGLFMLGGGKIDGKPILPDGWVDDATTNRLPASQQPATYGYFWWPMEAPNYRAIGIFGQGIQVFPDENLVIAVNSAMPKASDRTQTQKIMALAAAIRDAAPD